MAQQTSSAKRLQSLQSLERESEWGQSIRVKGKGSKGRVPLEVGTRGTTRPQPHGSSDSSFSKKNQQVSNAERTMTISTPKLTSVNLLTQAPASTT